MYDRDDGPTASELSARLDHLRQPHAWPLNGVESHEEGSETRAEQKGERAEPHAQPHARPNEPGVERRQHEFACEPEGARGSDIFVLEGSGCQQPADTILGIIAEMLSKAMGEAAIAVS